MTLFREPIKVKNFTTNLGLCFVIQNEFKYLIKATSDFTAMDKFIFKGDSELFLGRKFYFIDTDKNYEIIKINMDSNFDLAMEFEKEHMMGEMNLYSYKITLTVKEIQS